MTADKLDVYSAQSAFYLLMGMIPILMLMLMLLRFTPLNEKMILEVLAENCPVPAACVAVEDEFGEVGSQSYLQQRFGLTAAHIEEQAKAVITRK